MKKINYGSTFGTDIIYFYHWTGINTFGFYQSEPEGISEQYIVAIFKIKNRK